MVTVKDFLNTLEKDGVKLVSGQEGLDYVIDYLTVQEFSFKSPRIYKNGFVMTTFYGFKNLDEMIQHLDWYVQKEISGIGFHTAIFQEIPEEIKNYASKVKIPLFSIPKDLPYHSLYERYNELLYQETTRIKNNIEILNQKMLDSLVLEKDIHFIIQSVGKYLQVPIIYLNKDKEIVSLWSPKPISRSDLRSLFERLVLNRNEWFETSRMTNKVIERKNINHIDQLDSVLIIPLGNQISFYGYLLIINQKEAVPFQDSILKNAATALILDGIKKNQTIEFQKNKDIKQFEEIFLNNRSNDLNVEDFYYDINQLHSVVMVEPIDSKDLKKTFKLFNSYIEERDRNALVWIMDRRVIAILQKEFNFSFPESFNVQIGISDKIKEITNDSVQLLYEQAKISLHFAKLKNQTYCRWKDLGDELIIYSIRESNLLKEFHQEYIRDLIQYDQENQTELINTLYVYLNTFFSLKESGKQLHLHPNTVKYRIKKIQELVPVDIHAPVQYINLVISIKSYFYQVNHERLERN